MRRTRLALLCAIAGTAVPGALAYAEAPLPVLAGSKPTQPTKLRLIVAASTPYVLNVDDGRVTPVAHLAGGPAHTLWLVPFRGGALAVADRSDAGGRLVEQAVSIAVDGTSRVVASGRSVTPTLDGRAVWILDRAPNGRCAVRRTAGRTARARVPCGSLETDGPAGVEIGLADGTVLVDPRTGAVRARARSVAQLGGGLVLEERNDELANHGRLLLVDLASGRRRTLPWPSTLAGYGGALRSPDGSAVAVEFADPAHPGPEQADDLFLLDRRTGRFTHVPGFPATLDLKFSSVAWASDGRLVMLVRFDGTSRVGVYRPGDPAVSLRSVQLPQPTGGSDAFVPLEATS